MAHSPSALAGADGILDRIENALIALSALSIFVLMMIGVGQVVARTVWDYWIPGYIDYAEQAAAIAAFVTLGYAERLRSHIRLDVLPSRLSGKPALVVEVFSILVAFVTTALLVYATWWSFLRAWQLGDSTLDIQLPIWPTKLLVTVSLVLLLLRLGMRLVRVVRNPSLATAPIHNFDDGGP